MSMHHHRRLIGGGHLELAQSHAPQKPIERESSTEVGSLAEELGFN